MISRLSKRLAAVMAVGTAMLWSHPVLAKQPVVIELFTSQGCHSCPPADALLGELKDNPAILPLSMHVTYWNRLGWTDTFSKKAFDKRQVEYSTLMGQRHVFTPQAVINGVFSATGSDRRRIGAILGQIASMPEPDPDVELDDRTLQIRGIQGPYRVIVAGIADEYGVKIDRGENAGKTIDYHNVVQDWVDVGFFQGDGLVDLPFDKIDRDRSDRRVVLIQQMEDGRIVYADLQFIN